MPNFRAIATRAAVRNGIPPQLFLRQIQQESGFNPNARSSSGAVGIAQIVPHWHPGVDARDPVASLNYAAHLMGALVKKYGDYAQALSVYNSGKPEAYKDPNFAGGQTFRYVKDIMSAAPVSPADGAPAPFTPAPGLGAPMTPRAGMAGLLRQSLNEGNKLLGMAPLNLPVPHGLPAMQMQPPVATPGESVPASPLPLTGKPSLKFIETFAKPFGLTVTSTTGGKHATHSYHYQGRAVDFGGAPDGMAALAKYALAHAGEFTEMFYTGPGHPGFFISGGKVLPLSELDHGLYVEHENHVHLAR